MAQDNHSKLRRRKNMGYFKNAKKNKQNCFPAGGTGYDPSGTSFRGGGRGRGRGTFPPKISPFHNASTAAMPTATSPTIPTPGLYNATTAASGIPACKILFSASCKSRTLAKR